MLNINEILIATKGKLINGKDKEVIPQNYIVDSREMVNDSFFIPIIGNKSNGNDYILDTVKNGVQGYFLNSNLKNKESIIKESLKINKNVYIIEVEDTLVALQEAAQYNRYLHIDIPIVAITGSVGKTSTREMIASVLSEEKKVLTTEKNFNGNIGLPIMLLKISNQEICIFEAGIDTIGEMEVLSNMLKPDVAIITKIGTSHIEFFGSQEKIYKEKIQITNHIKGIKKLIVNGNDKILSNEKSTKKYEVQKFVIEDAYDIIKEKEEIKFKTKIYEKEEIIRINEIGLHNIMNALSAIKVGELFNISPKNILNGIAKYKNFTRRLEKKVIKNNIIIIDDTYNASIDSMKSGLFTIDSMQGKRKIAVLGDMLELGEYTESLHRQVGKLFKELKYDMLFTSGKAARFIAIEAKPYFNKDTIKSFNNKEDLEKELKKELKSGDIVYFKASNIMKFNEIILKIQEM